MSIIYNGLQNLRPVATQQQLLSARTRNYGYYPLITTNTAPVFYLPVESKIAGRPLNVSFGRETHFSINDYLDKPLVLAFFNARGNLKEFIKNLESLRSDINVMGGRLLVITSIQPKYLKKQLAGYENIIMYYDKDNAIAEMFGLYDASNPLWQWLTGIDDELLAMPALYVISAEREIVYHHIDYNLSLYDDNNYYTRPFLRQLLTAVFNTNKKQTYQAIGYRSVS